jgi:hypothetical protein
MIRLYFHIKNPWSKENFKNLFNWSKPVSKNKVIEIELTRYSYDLVSFSLNTNTSGEDHAGPEILISLLGYTASIKIYDTRHWDYENKKWTEYS